MKRQLYERLLVPNTQISLNLDEVAQASHVAIGAAIVGLTSARFGGGSKYWAAGIVAILAGVKEFWWDQTYEDAATRGSNLEDFSYYICGECIALLILWGNG